MSGSIPTTSIRERILDHIATRFKNAAAGGSYTTRWGDTHTYQFTWSGVHRRPASQNEMKYGHNLVILDVKEQKARETGYDRAHIQVNFEFYMTVLTGDEPSTVLNAALLEVQTILGLDLTCGGLSIDIREIKNELDILGSAEKVVAGMLEVHVVYRHRPGDPRRTS